MEYLDREITEGFNPLHYYLAQVAMEVRRSYVKKPKSVHLDDFILKFKEKRPVGREEKETIEQLRARTARSKAFWLGITAFSKGKSRRPPPKNRKGK